ncbi:MAG TPA: bacillithiol biosynthesis deacetylase BshB1 [Ignavibacteria bacterium]|nr:bacillithiol biosynthesis deacetylase BshB1 [Ignavibacteria bacterium]
MLSLKEAGKKIGIIDLTLGELSTRGNPELRKKETKNASDLMQLDFRENLNIRDGNIELNEVNRKKIIRAIRKYRPEIIFAPYPFDRHPDHIYAGNLIRESLFYSGLSKIKSGNLKAYRPSKVYYYRNALDIPISFIFDITETFKKKLEVIKCFGSQFHNINSKEPLTFISTELFDKEIESRARHFGFKIGKEFGEPFFSNDPFQVSSNILFDL